MILQTYWSPNLTSELFKTE